MLKKSHLTRDILQTLVLIGSLRLVLSFSHGLMTQILLQQMFGTAGYRCHCGSRSSCGRPVWTTRETLNVDILRIAASGPTDPNRSEILIILKTVGWCCSVPKLPLDVNIESPFTRHIDESETCESRSSAIELGHIVLLVNPIEPHASAHLAVWPRLSDSCIFTGCPLTRCLHACVNHENSGQKNALKDKPYALCFALRTVHRRRWLTRGTVTLHHINWQFGAFGCISEWLSSSQV